jgi:hypothetical protein
MKKIGLLALALVLALGSLGIGYAHWTETLQIKGDINTGWIDVNFMSQYDNDGVNMIDPTGPGEWDFSGPAPVWNGARLNDPPKDVAQTTSTYSTWDQQRSPANPTGNFAEIIVTNGYPSYWGSVAWDLKNHGSVPVELWTVTLVEVKHLPAVFAPDMELAIGVRYYVDAYTGTVDETLDGGDDFSFILSAHGTEQLDPDTWDDDDWNTTAYLDVTVHIEQDAQQKTSYEFTIDYLFANWNEVDGATP